MNDTTTKRGRGRPPIFGKPMTRREILLRHEAKRKAEGRPSRSQLLAALRTENAVLREVADVGRQLVAWYVRPIGGRFIGAMSPSGLCDPSEISRLWERLHGLVHGCDK
ncbi:hypothetical protein ACWJKU_17190 [Methylocaldum sp. MU1018]